MDKQGFIKKKTDTSYYPWKNSVILNDNTWTWFREENFNRETESLVIGA